MSTQETTFVEAVQAEAQRVNDEAAARKKLAEAQPAAGAPWYKSTTFQNIAIAVGGAAVGVIGSMLYDKYFSTPALALPAPDAHSATEPMVAA